MILNIRSLASLVTKMTILNIRSLASLVTIKDKKERKKVIQ